MAGALRSPLAPDALAGSVAVVTGGGTGIGAATATAIVQAGGAVAICGRRPGTLEQGAAARGGACFARPCDIREPDQVSSFLDDVAERFDRVDILVNNAGGQF